MARFTHLQQKETQNELTQIVMKNSFLILATRRKPNWQKTADWAPHLCMALIEM